MPSYASDCDKTILIDDSLSQSKLGITDSIPKSQKDGLNKLHLCPQHWQAKHNLAPNCISKLRLYTPFWFGESGPGRQLRGVVWALTQPAAHQSKSQESLAKALCCLHGPRGLCHYCHHCQGWAQTRRRPLICLYRQGRRTAGVQ